MNFIYSNIINVFMIAGGGAGAYGGGGGGGAGSYIVAINQILLAGSHQTLVGNAGLQPTSANQQILGCDSDIYFNYNILYRAKGRGNGGGYGIFGTAHVWGRAWRVPRGTGLFFFILPIATQQVVVPFSSLAFLSKHVFSLESVRLLASRRSTPLKSEDCKRTKLLPGGPVAWSGKETAGPAHKRARNAGGVEDNKSWDEVVVYYSGYISHSLL